MFKEMLSEKEFDFNALEKEIFRIGCEFAAGLMEQLLVRMDEHLMLNRDRQNYRHKGKHTTTLKTLMGEVPYRRKAVLRLMYTFWTRYLILNHLEKFHLT